MSHHDVVIIGAGFSGMYQLIRLRELGFDVRVVERGSDVGGTWYWNRYPGARCDIESIEYSYSFDEQLQQEWDWSERYAAQPELLAYAQHVAERHDLRPHISFDTEVTRMEWDEAATRWVVSTADGSSLTATYVIAATGCLSQPSKPQFEGLPDFAGDVYWTSAWPHDGVDLSGKRVGVVGTGSSGLQTITAIAPVVGELTVFQRTPSYAIPAHNGPVGERLGEVRSYYGQFREASRYTRGGFQCETQQTPLLELPREQVDAELDRSWAKGGLCFQGVFPDVLRDPQANEVAAEYVRQRIRERVKDPEVAERLIPRTYPIATKRMCVDTGYYEVFNQDNVSLVDLNEEPIRRVTPTGILAGETEHELDVIIMATGFDAMTGALLHMDIRNGDRTLAEKWAHGPRTYLGLMSEGFPNLFMITGPQSPSVLSNMMTSIEQHVDWVTRLLAAQRDQGRTRVEPEPEAEDNWVNANNDLAEFTLFPRAASWYMGANIPGKQRILLPFVGGVDTYKLISDGVAASSYHGFERV